MKPIHILFWLVIASPLLALIPTTQDPAATDWPKEIERACKAQRYQIRVAAANRVAAGGAAAAPALVAFVAQKGKNELPVTLVEAIAEKGSNEPPVLDLLHEWALDRDFYWRATAFKGLAKRAPAVPDRRDALATLFTTHHADPAWLVRVHARLGTALLGGAPVSGDVLAQPEHDPRAVAKLTALLLQNGKNPPLQPLLDALADERTCLADPWGQRRAKDCFDTLKAWLGDAHPLRAGESFADPGTALAAMLAAVRTKSGQQLQMPAPLLDPTTPFAGGFEILSCRNGDLFVQWTATGEIHFGIDAATAVQLPGPVWDTLSKERTALQLDQNFGVVICDNMRLRWGPPDVHVKVAPQSLPEATSKWLLHLAKALEEADQPRHAAALRTGLEQFAPR